MKFVGMIVLSFGLLAGGCAAAGDLEESRRFLIPDGMATSQELHPSGYLEDIKVADTSEKLSERDLADLTALFVAAAQACREKYKQDCSLSTSAPVYELLASNVPGVSSVVGEGGRMVFLGDIAKEFGQ